MKNIPIIEWTDAFVGYKERYLLRTPYMDIESIEEGVRYLNYQFGQFYGIMSPYSEDNVEFNIRCASRLRDRLPEEKIYVAVPFYKTYERIKTIYRAGFKHIVVPQYLGGVQYDHYFQFIQPNELDALTLHIAGGEFTSPTWNLERWSWSKEVL